VSLLIEEDINDCARILVSLGYDEQIATEIINNALNAKELTKTLVFSEAIRKLDLKPIAIELLGEHLIESLFDEIEETAIFALLLENDMKSVEYYIENFVGE